MTQQRRTGTRERIQETALELFTAQGYENTSLREIAERLGVTKAALYYHFKTKEDIVASFFAGYLDDVDGLIAEYSERKPADDAERRALLDRYLDIVQNDHLGQALRFLQENQPAMRKLAMGTRMKDTMLRLMVLMTDDEAPYEAQVRARLALLSVHITFYMGQGLAPLEMPGEEERARVSRTIALDLLTSGPDSSDSTASSEK